MRVKEVMKQDVLTIDKTALVGEAARLMKEQKSSGLPVMDGDQVVGMITESDIVQMSIPDILQMLGQVPDMPWLEEYFEKLEQLTNRKVEEIVNTHGAVTITEEEQLGKAIALMVAKKIKKLPVLRDGKLVGTLTYSDIISLMAKNFEENNKF